MKIFGGPFLNFISKKYFIFLFTDSVSFICIWSLSFCCRIQIPSILCKVFYIKTKKIPCILLKIFNLLQKMPHISFVKYLFPFAAFFKNLSLKIFGGHLCRLFYFFLNKKIPCRISFRKIFNHLLQTNARPSLLIAKICFSAYYNAFRIFHW